MAQGDNMSMTKNELREHYAGLAMQGWLARCANVPHGHKLEPVIMAEVAVKIADALLAELEKGGSDVTFIKQMVDAAFPKLPYTKRNIGGKDVYFANDLSVFTGTNEEAEEAN